MIRCAGAELPVRTGSVLVVSRGGGAALVTGSGRAGTCRTERNTEGGGGTAKTESVNTPGLYSMQLDASFQNKSGEFTPASEIEVAQRHAFKVKDYNENCSDMSGSGDADPGPGSSGFSGLSSGDTGLSLSAGRVLPGRIRCLSNPAPPGRLPSLRTRDMTLGGAYKKPKKTFEPNVHAVRKSKDELKGKTQTASKPQRTEREEKRREKREKRGRRRERERERAPTIQSHSIFEQGPADSSRRPGCRGVADVRDSASSSVCQLVEEEPEEDEEEILSKLHRDDFIDDLDLENRSKVKPIQLPLSQSVAFMKSPSLSRSSCVYGSVAHGPENPPPLRPQSTGGPGPAVCSRTESRPPQASLVDLLQELSLSGSEELFFMQLPDCMPFRPKKETHKDQKTEDRRPGLEAVVKEACPVLSQLPEGFLGKLQIRRSGSVVLKVGDVVMDVSEGAAFSFLQQLVSVRLSDGQTGDMMVLGNVRHKLVLSPDFHTFLQQTATQQQQ